MSQLSFIQNLGLKLLGSNALATIKGEVVKLTERSTEQKVRGTVEVENTTRPLGEVVGRGRLEEFFRDALKSRAGAGGNQVTAALLLALVHGDTSAAHAISKAAQTAEDSGEGFMKKKAAVLKVVREVSPGLKKSQEQLLIELAVQSIKD